MNELRHARINCFDNDVNHLNDFSDEKIAMLVDGYLSESEREGMLRLLLKNGAMRRKVSDYVKLKRHKRNDNDVNNQSNVSPALTKKAFSLFRKFSNTKSAKCLECEPIYINYSQNEYEITGIIQSNNETLLNLELHITKDGHPYTGKIYIYKGNILYHTLDIHEEYITCDLLNKGNYHLYIKDSEIVDNNIDLEFEIK